MSDITNRNRANPNPLYSLYHETRFYGSTGESNSTFESYIDTANVFSGQYLDEFCLPSLMRPILNQKVLLLGLGLGSGVRPILASNQVSSIIGVDVDPQSIASAGQFFSNHFPRLNLTIEAGDAFNFLQHADEGSFDVIWIDLFDKEGFATCLADTNFYDLILSRLTSEGIVAINAYTIPVFLGMFKHHSPEQRISSFLNERFDNVAFFPYRRNITLLASNYPLQNESPQSSKPILNSEDASVLLTNSIRVAHGPRIPPSHQSSSDPALDCLKFEKIGTLLKDAISEFETLWRKKGRIGRGESFLSILKDRERAQQLTQMLVADEPGDLKAVTVAYALLANSCKEDFSWYIETILGLVDDPHSIDMEDLLNCHFPQLLSMTRNYSEQFNPDRRYAPLQSDLFDRIKRCEDASERPDSSR